MSEVGTVAWTARALLREGLQRIQASGAAPARHEVEWLLSAATGMPALELYVNDPVVSDRAVERFLAHVASRIAGAPLQYLIGVTEFFGERFAVQPGVLIPRPETEAIVEAAIDALRLRQQQVERPLRLLDLGTGSGCIAVTLARRLPACVVVGVEVSWTALRIAQHNARRLGVGQRVRLIQGDWAQALRGVFDGIISNPPYVPSAEVDRLPPDVRQEPRLSLDGGVDGLRDLVTILSQAPRMLAPGGLLALECGEEQAPELLRQVQALMWVARGHPVRDLAGRLRGLLVTKRA